MSKMPGQVLGPYRVSNKKDHHKQHPLRIFPSQKFTCHTCSLAWGESRQQALHFFSTAGLIMKMQLIELRAIG